MKRIVTALALLAMINAQASLIQPNFDKAAETSGVTEQRNFTTANKYGAGYNRYDTARQKVGVSQRQGGLRDAARQKAQQVKNIGRNLGRNTGITGGLNLNNVR